MTIKRLNTYPGKFGRPIDVTRKEWARSGILKRMWVKDAALWPDQDANELSTRLGWLELPTRMPERLGILRGFADEIRAESIENVVLIGMGGSSLAPEVFHRVLGSREGFPRLIVCDSIHPDRILEIKEQIDLEKSFFLVSSKSGTTLETLSLLQYFWDLLERSELNPGHYFAAITDPETPLSAQAREMGFRRIFSGRSDVGGRFSALSEFGVIPAILTGMNVESAFNILKADSPHSEDIRAGLELGAFLGGISAGGDKLTFIMSESYESFPDWIEQLVAESLGKEGRGIIPVVHEPALPVQDYGRDRSFVLYTDSSDFGREQARLVSSLVEAGFPVIHVEMGQRDELLSEMFRWEIAVACAGIALKVNPFNQPDVQSAKIRAGQMLEEGISPSDEDLFLDEGRMTDLIGFLDSARPGDYVTLQCFLAPTQENGQRLQSVRQKIRDRTGRAVTFGYGPRYLHSTGQLHKGGPDSGLFIQLKDVPQKDIPVPGSGHTFSQILEAQAWGDYTALREAGRRIFRIDLGKDTRAGLQSLLESI